MRRRLTNRLAARHGANQKAPRHSSISGVSKKRGRFVGLFCDFLPGIACANHELIVGNARQRHSQSSTSRCADVDCHAPYDASVGSIEFDGVRSAKVNNEACERRKIFWIFFQ